VNHLAVLLRPLDGEANVGNIVAARIQLSLGFAQHDIDRNFVNGDDIQGLCSSNTAQ
jgi:hypothetical protein